MKPVVPLCQAGISDFLGDGPKNIGQSGCLLTCIAMALNAYRTQLKPWTPQALNRYYREAGLYSGSRLLTELAVRRLGLTYGCPRGALVRSELDAALEANDLVIVGVDYKEGSSSAFSKSDHFVLFFHFDTKTDTYMAVNPSTGNVIRFDKEEIEHRVSDTRIYRAVEQIVLRKKTI